jgi:hypothetical protein
MVLRCRCCVDMLVRRGSVLVGADQCVPVPPSLDHGWSAPRRIMSHCPLWSVPWIFAARVRVGDGGAPFDLGLCPARVARRQRLPGEGRWQRSGGRASDFRTAAPPDPPGVGTTPTRHVRARAGPLRVAPDRQPPPARAPDRRYEKISSTSRTGPRQVWRGRAGAGLRTRTSPGTGQPATAATITHRYVCRPRSRRRCTDLPMSGRSSTHLECLAPRCEVGGCGEVGSDAEEVV